MSRPFGVAALLLVIVGCQALSPSQKYLQKRLQCESGETQRCLELAVEEDRGGNFKVSHYFLRLACENGSKNCDMAGLLDLRSKDEESALRHWEMGCDSGDAFCCHSLGNFERDRRNQVASQKWFRKACDRGAQESCSRVTPSKDSNRNLGGS